MIFFLNSDTFDLLMNNYFINEKWSTNFAAIYSAWSLLDQGKLSLTT